MRQSCRAGRPMEPPAEAEPPLPSLGLSTRRGLAILLLLPLLGSPSTFPIRIPGTSAVPELGCRAPLERHLRYLQMPSKLPEFFCTRLLKSLED